ncbi:hypothetical protein FRB94_008941 [Tulasnella sp. JGI-2019a]|nr:hypothetical protein FRB94_008941 [Tulasnella sp. JGI-2019a]KAG9027401.1 hypothetical protein FRB95_007803 [Tulasnella sp. JGI-2019a]
MSSIPNTTSTSNIGHTSLKMDGHVVDTLRDNHAKVPLADFLIVMVPVSVQKEDSWKHFQKSVQIDTVIKAAIKESRKATREPALYAPFAAIANQITMLFKQHCDPLVKGHSALSTEEEGKGEKKEGKRSQGRPI